MNTHEIEREGEIFFLLGATTGQIYIVLMIGVNLGLGIVIHVRICDPTTQLDS